MAFFLWQVTGVAIWEALDSGISELITSLSKNTLSLDWFKGKSTGNHGFYHQIQGFPVNFPIIQFYDIGKYNEITMKKLVKFSKWIHPISNIFTQF
jgi:hypothetical protein